MKRSRACTSNMIGWVESTDLLMFHFKWNNIRGFKSGVSWDQFQSVTREDTAKEKTKELLLIAMLFFPSVCLSSSLPPPPPPSTCLCAGLLLISEAPSFVFVRCRKDSRMKRDTWRGDGWLWLWHITTHTHTPSQSPLTVPCQRTLSITLSFTKPASLAHRCLFRKTQVKSSGGTKWRGWNLIETALDLGGRGATEQQSAAQVQDRWGFHWLGWGWVCVWVCVFLGW